MRRGLKLRLSPFDKKDRDHDRDRDEGRAIDNSKISSDIHQLVMFHAKSKVALSPQMD